eukprot:2222924-Alexandrium_andersonii.AAC.1
MLKLAEIHRAPSNIKAHPADANPNRNKIRKSAYIDQGVWRACAQAAARIKRSKLQLRVVSIRHH